MTLRKLVAGLFCAGVGIWLGSAQAVAGDALGLGKAVEVAGATSKGTPIAAKTTASGFEVHVVAGGKTMSIPVDAKGTASAGKEIPGENAELVKALTDGKQTLSGAIMAAEAHSKGKATSAKAWMNAGKLEFLIGTMVGDKTMNVTVDNTGKAVKMDEAKAGGAPKGHEQAKPAEKKP